MGLKGSQYTLHSGLQDNTANTAFCFFWLFTKIDTTFALFSYCSNPSSSFYLSPSSAQQIRAIHPFCDPCELRIRLLNCLDRSCLVLLDRSFLIRLIVLPCPLDRTFLISLTVPFLVPLTVAFRLCGLLLASFHQPSLLLIEMDKY